MERTQYTIGDCVGVWWHSWTYSVHDIVGHSTCDCNVPLVDIVEQKLPSLQKLMSFTAFSMLCRIPNLLGSEVAKGGQEALARRWSRSGVWMKKSDAERLALKNIIDIYLRDNSESKLWADQLNLRQICLYRKPIANRRNRSLRDFMP